MNQSPDITKTLNLDDLFELAPRMQIDSFIIHFGQDDKPGVRIWKTFVDIRNMLNDKVRKNMKSPSEEIKKQIEDLRLIKDSFLLAQNHFRYAAHIKALKAQNRPTPRFDPYIDRLQREDLK